MAVLVDEPRWAAVRSFAVMAAPVGGVRTVARRVQTRSCCAAAGRSRARSCLTRKTRIGCRCGCLKGRKPLSFRKGQILEVVSKASALDDYFDKKKKAPETPQGQFDLGIWCEQNKLTDLAKLHFEGALAIDKSFEPAHKKLGHVYHGGYWVTRDELNSIQGLVKYKGRWVSAEERAQREAEDKAAGGEERVGAADQDAQAVDL